MSVYLNVIEYGVQSYPHPDMSHDNKGMGGWHFMRIEYHDTEKPHAFLEHHVWMPPGVSSAVLEDWMQERLQEGGLTKPPKYDTFNSEPE